MRDEKQSLVLATKVIAAINRRAKEGDKPVKPSEIMAEAIA